MRRWTDIVANAGLELAYFGGLSGVAERRAMGRGVIVRFQRVRPRVSSAFQPLAHLEISPRFLDRAIRMLKRRGFDIVSLDEALTRLQAPTGARRFVVLTFDGAYRDFIDYAYPVLNRHEVPFAIYVPTGFLDQIAEAWWLALEAVVRQTPRIALVMNGEERRFRAASVPDKHAVFDVIHDWMLTSPPEDVSAAINDLCRRYGVDLKVISRDMAMTWADVTRLGADPRATIGSATVNYPVPAQCKTAALQREMKMGRTILEAALHQDCPHFAYPFGTAQTISSRDILLAREAGFVCAVSSRAGLLASGSDTMNLPRIAWDGRRTSTRALQVVLSGLTCGRDTAKQVSSQEAAGLT